MNLYENWILPPLLDLVMRVGEVTRYRQAVVPQASGTVLEVGVGSGLNLKFYGTHVRRLYALDPSSALLRMAQRKIRGNGTPTHLLAAAAESIPIEDTSIDTVIMTFTLCTIADPAKALHEMRRVLKPGGRLVFAEHGLAPDPSVQRWQHRCNAVWNRIAGGCNLDRRIDALITASGFEIRELTTEYSKAPRMLGYVYAGVAVPGTAPRTSPAGFMERRGE